ncbi:hypothetical protein SDC9_151321 [bioreactor metagenome]|uniref:Uncharacterized protein n=1 Tax=bioreactor metagenome TaxID=1076179 RepID=A0A645EPY8_9ZZZZ
MQENPKADELVPQETQADTEQRQMDEKRKKYAGNGMAVGMCVGMVGGLIFITKFGLPTLIIGGLIGSVGGIRAGLEIFKRKH